MQTSSQSQSESHCFYREISQPTAILHSLRSSFLSPYANNFIIVKAGVLEIYNIDHEAGKPLNSQTLTPISIHPTASPSQYSTTTLTPITAGISHHVPALPSSSLIHQSILTNTTCAPILTLHTSAKLFGNVVAMQTIVLPKQTTESLALLFDDNSISILHWDPISLSLCTVFVHNAELRDMKTPHGEESTGVNIITAETLTDMNNMNNSGPNNRFSQQYNDNKQMADDQYGLQHLQQQQLLNSLLIVDNVNKLVIICQAGCFFTIYCPNPHCNQLLFSPGRISTLSPLITHQLSRSTSGGIDFDTEKIEQHSHSRQFHIETPHHCAHLLQSIPDDRLAMVPVCTINLRRWRNSVVWVKDCIVCYSNTTTGSSNPTLVCLVNTELTWEGRYSSKKNSSALVTINIPIPTLAKKSVNFNNQNNNNFNNFNNYQHFQNPLFNPIEPTVFVPQSNLPHNSYKLVSLPQPLLGCLLITSSSVLYFNLTILAFATKLNFFDFLTQNVKPVDGVREETGVVLDRISITCVYAAVETVEDKVQVPGNNVVKNVIKNNNLNKKSSNNFDDDFDSFLSDSNNTDKSSSTTTKTKVIYPYHELYDPLYASSPFVLPFKPAPQNRLQILENSPPQHNSQNNPQNNFTTNSTRNNSLTLKKIPPFLDPELHDRTRYLEFLVSTIEGASFTLSITFPTTSRISSLSLGYLGMLSPVTNFVPLILGAPVVNNLNDITGRKNEGDDDSQFCTNAGVDRHVGCLIFAASLWGDSKVYQLEREITMGPNTQHNSYCNNLVNFYNIILEENEKGYPIFSPKDDEFHKNLFLGLKGEKNILEYSKILRQKSNKKVLNDGNSELVGPRRPPGFKPVQIAVGNDEKKDENDEKKDAKMDQNDTIDPYGGDDMFDFDALRELGLRVQEEVKEQQDNYELKLQQKIQHQKLIDDFKKSHQNLSSNFDIFAQDSQEVISQNKKNSDKNINIEEEDNGGDDGNDGNDDDNDDDDDDDDDEITYEQRKRRLVRPVAAPWVIIERDILFGFGPLSNLTPISTNLTTPYTNTTSNAVNMATSKENMDKFGDKIPLNTLPFASDRSQKETISLVATSSTGLDGKVVVYNDAINPYVISTQDVRVGDYFSGGESDQKNDQNEAESDKIGEKNQNVDPSDVITGMFSFVVRDVPGFIQQTWNVHQPPIKSTKNNQKGDKNEKMKKNAPNPQNQPTFDPKILFELDPLLSLHQVKQIIRHKVRGKKSMGVENITELNLHTAVTQYQSSLLFLEKLTQASNTVLSPQHTITTENIDPSAVTVLVLTTNSQSLFFTIPNCGGDDKNGEKNPLNFAQKFQNEISKFQQLHLDSYRMQLDDMNYQWRNAHTKRQQERWEVDQYQAILAQQQKTLQHQQESYIGIHAQDLTQILNSLGATQFVPVGNRLDDFRGDTNKNQNFVISTQINTKLLSHPFSPTTHLKTIISAPILGLLRAWVQVTPNIVNLCTGIDQVLCQIPLSKILAKCAVQWEEKFSQKNCVPNDDNNSHVINPFDNLITTTHSHHYSLEPIPITIINALIQDPYVVLQLSNNYLVVVEFNANPLHGNWYTTTLLSFATTSMIRGGNNLGESIDQNDKNNLQKKDANFNEFDVDRITAMTTCEVDLFVLCPQLRTLLTSPLSKLEMLDKHYLDLEMNLVRKDVLNLLQNSGKVKSENSNKKNNKNNNNFGKNNLFDDLDLLMDSNENTNTKTNLLKSSTHADSTKGSDSDFIPLFGPNGTPENDFDAKNDKIDDQNDSNNEPIIDSFLTSMPSLKLLIISTLTFLYIIDLNTVTPTSLYLIHLNILNQNNQSGSKNDPKNDQSFKPFGDFGENGYIAVPLFTSITPGSSQHTLHNVNNIDLNYPSFPSLPFFSQKSLQNAHNAQSTQNTQNTQNPPSSPLNSPFTTDSTPIKEIIFGCPDTQTSSLSNNPHNGHYILLRDQSDQILIYSLTETLLSFMPRKLLNVVNYIRTNVPKIYPQLAHLITGFDLNGDGKLGTDLDGYVLGGGLKGKGGSNNGQGKDGNRKLNKNDSSKASMSMTFLDVLLEYSLLLQSLQVMSCGPNLDYNKNKNSTKNTPKLPYHQLASISPLDILHTLSKPVDLFNASFSHCDMTHFSSLLTHFLTTLPLVLRLEYTNIDDRLYLQERQAIDFLPNQLKTDLSRYAEILYDLYAKYIHQVGKQKLKFEKMVKNRDLNSKSLQGKGNKSSSMDDIDTNMNNTSSNNNNNNNNNNDYDEDDDDDDDNNNNNNNQFGRGFDQNNNYNQSFSNQQNFERNFDENNNFDQNFGSNYEFDFEKFQIELSKHDLDQGNDIPYEYRLPTELEIQSTVHRLLTNYSLYHDTGLLDHSHFNTTLSEFEYFSTKLSLFNRLSAYSTFQRLSTEQQAQFYQSLAVDTTPALHSLDLEHQNVNFGPQQTPSIPNSPQNIPNTNPESSQITNTTTPLGCLIGTQLLSDYWVKTHEKIAEFNKDTQLPLALSLVSFSRELTTKRTQQIKKLTNIVVNYLDYGNDTVVKENIENKNDPNNNGEKNTEISLEPKLIQKIAKHLLRYDFEYFSNKKYYFNTQIQQFNFTTLSKKTLIPFKQNDHNGVIVLGLTPQMILFNHNSSSNTITTVPLHFNAPNPESTFSSYNSIIKNQISQSSDQILQNFPTFSQSRHMSTNLSDFEQFFYQPSHISSAAVISLPHLQTNILLFSDLKNTLISCQLPPKFPSTIPTTGSTVSFSLTNKSLSNTELTLFNWNLNKQQTDSMTNNKLLVYNAANQSLRQQALGYLQYNLVSVQQKLFSKFSNFDPSTTVTPIESTPELIAIQNARGNPTLQQLTTNGQDFGATVHNFVVNNPQKMTKIINLDQIGGKKPPQSGNNKNVQLGGYPPIPTKKTSSLLDLEDDLIGEVIAPVSTLGQNGNKRPLQPMMSDPLDDLLGDDDLGLSITTQNTTTQKNDPKNDQNKKPKLHTSDNIDILPQPGNDIRSAIDLSHYEQYNNQNSITDDNKKPLYSKFSIISSLNNLTPAQSYTLFYCVTQSSLLQNHSNQNIILQLKQVVNPNLTTSLLTSSVLTSTNTRQSSLSSPSPSAQPHNFVYTNNTPNGLIRFKQLKKTPTHLIIHPNTYTIGIATQTVVESGTAEIFEAFQMPVMVNTYQLDFFSLHQGQWLATYNIPTTNPLSTEFDTETKHDEVVTAITLLTLYDETAQEQQKRLLKTATKSKFGVWCSNGDPITPQTHPRAYTTTTYIALATSVRDGPLKNMKSTLVLLDLSSRTAIDINGTVRRFLKVQRILEHIERLPIHGLAVLSCDIQKPQGLSYPVPDERIAFINNYANPFNHFHTHIVLACGYKVFIYRLSYDENKLLGEAFFNTTFFISSLYTIKNLIVCNDILKSVTILIYDVSNRNLALFASDYNVTLPLITSSPFLAKKTFSLLLFDYDQHISQLEFNVNDINSTKYKRLITNFKYYLGQNVLSSANVHIGDLVNKVKLNNTSKLIDIVSKSDILTTNTPSKRHIGGQFGSPGPDFFLQHPLVPSKIPQPPQPTQTLALLTPNFGQHSVLPDTGSVLNTSVHMIANNNNNNNNNNNTPGSPVVNVPTPTATDLLLYPFYAKHQKQFYKLQQRLEDEKKKEEEALKKQNEQFAGLAGVDKRMGKKSNQNQNTLDFTDNSDDLAVAPDDDDDDDDRTDGENNADDDNGEVDSDDELPETYEVFLANFHLTQNDPSIITSGTLSTALTTHGYDLSLSLLFHFKKLLLTMFQANQYSILPPIQHNNIFVTSHYAMIEKYCTQHELFLKLDNGLMSYFSLFAETPFKQNLSNGFLSSLSNTPPPSTYQNNVNFLRPPAGNTTITTANYVTTQDGAFLFFMPITTDQQYLLTLLSNTIQNNFPFIAATSPSAYHEARTTATFLGAANDKAGEKGEQTQSAAKQNKRAMIDTSLLLMYLSIQQRQKKVIAKNIATTTQTLLDVVKYLFAASKLHPLG